MHFDTRFVEGGVTAAQGFTANGILCEGRGVRALPLKSGISFYLGSLRITAGRLGEAGEKESMEEDAV